MRSWVLAAGLLAAAVTTGAQAADLDDGPPRIATARPTTIRATPTSTSIRGRRAMRGRRPGLRRARRLCRPPIPRERVYRDDEAYERDYPRTAALLPRRSGRALRRALRAARAGEGSAACARAGTTSTTATCAADRHRPRPASERPPVRADHRPLQRRDRQRAAARAAPLRPLRLRRRRRGAGTGPTELARDACRKAPAQAGAFSL